MSHQKILFNEIVKQERELRINLFDYKQRIEDKNKPKKEREILAINHDTLLFNYYEYLSICIFKSLIDERESKLYFLSPLNAVKNLFDLSILFEEEYAEKEQYPGVQWLFKKWDID